MSGKEELMKGLGAVTDEKLKGLPEKFVGDVKNRLMEKISERLSKGEDLTLQIYDKTAERGQVVLPDNAPSWQLQNSQCN